MTGSGERFATVGEIELCYEEFGEADGRPMLLIMGLATQMIGWHEDFCGELAERGFRVIRFDNRDIGRSTTLDSAPVPGRSEMLLGRGIAAYKLTDLAADATGLLDALEIDSAHVVGASMGGMIAQTMAIESPERVRSLASIMSGVGSRRTGLPRPRAFSALIKPAPADREGYAEHAVRLFRVIGSPGFERDEDELRERARLSWDRGRDPRGIARQMHAISSSPSRVGPLAGVRRPTVVIHGSRDPLVRLAAGKATARAIQGARLEIIEGMGHDLPRGAWPRMVEAIAANAERGERASEEAADEVPA